LQYGTGGALPPVFLFGPRHTQVRSRMRRVLASLVFASLITAPLFAQSFEERVAPCLACHGEKGQSETSETPSLGGQQAPYVLIQLFLFREKQRVVEIMNEMAPLNDEQIADLAYYMARVR